jgi:hypothetical protein
MSLNFVVTVIASRAARVVFFVWCCVDYSHVVQVLLLSVLQSSVS